MTKSNQGFISIVLLFMISYMLISVFCWIYFVIAALRSQVCLVERQKAFYFAASGLEAAKLRLRANPDWHTDASLIADKAYLLTVASGETFLIGDGGCKIISAKGGGTVYSIGFLGLDICSSSAYSFQEMFFSLPFRKTGWREL